MASLSKGPKTVQYGRRLFELLEEQQEPFLLDVYLSENGFFSTGALKAEGKANYCPVSLCRRILKLCSNGWLKRRSSSSSSSRGGSNLRHVLGKLLHHKVVKKVLNWNGTANAGKGRMCLCGCLPEMGGSKSSFVEFQRLSKSGGIDDGESDGEVSWRAIMEVGESKQLSPVSVLELHSDEGSPIHSHYEDEKPSTSGSSPKKAFDAPWQGFEELLGSTSPTIIHQNAKQNTELDQSEQVMALLGCPMEGECLSPQFAEKLIEDQLSSWEKMRVDFLKIPNLIGSDVSKSTKEWSQFHPEMTKIGKEIENLIFEEIRRESVLDLLGSHCTLETC